MQYALPYIILFVVYGILAVIYRTADDDQRHRIHWACGIIFVLFFGLRGYVGTDWTHYYPEFDVVYVGGIRELLYSIDRSGFEPGFVILMTLVKSVYDSYFLLVFVISVINFLLLYRFMRTYTDNIPLTMAVFLVMNGTGIELNAMRNSISILIFLNTIEYIQKRRMFPFMAWNIFAMSFHVSSILYLPLYFLLNKEFNKWVLVGIMVVGNLVLILKIHFLGPIMMLVAERMGEVYVKMVEVYTEGEEARNVMGLSIGLLERVLTAVLILCYYDRLKGVRKENVIFINSMMAYMFVFFFFSEFEVVCRRLALMFVFAYWVLWPDLLKTFQYRNNKILFASFIFVYGVFKINGMQGDILYQYDNILFGAKTYQERLYIFQKNVDEALEN